jgi:ABC-type nitrate/sulfonate/bicarbonate transport system substrate-binding protein
LIEVCMNVLARLLRNPVRALVALAATAAVSGAGAGFAGAQPAAPVEINFGILTPTASEWPLYIAQSQGFFKDEGLKVTIINGDSPPNVINSLATGAFDMADNGSDSEITAIAHGLPIKMIAPQFNVNPYSLVTSPTIKSWADLKGKSIMLGTKQDVTAIGLEQMAEAHGLKLDDFSIIIGGNSTARYAGLISGNVQGAMLGQPFDILAESKGMNILGSASDVTKEWVFTCVAVNNAWAAKNRPTIVKFLRALRKAVQYGYGHKADSVAALVAAAHTDPAIAGKAWDLDFAKWHAFDPNLKLATNGLQTVGKYQVGFGIIKEVPSMSVLYDPSFVAEATR